MKCTPFITILLVPILLAGCNRGEKDYTFDGSYGINYVSKTDSNGTTKKIRIGEDFLDFGKMDRRLLEFHIENNKASFCSIKFGFDQYEIQGNVEVKSNEHFNVKFQSEIKDDIPVFEKTNTISFSFEENEGVKYITFSQVENGITYEFNLTNKDLTTPNSGSSIVRFNEEKPFINIDLGIEGQPIVKRNISEEQEVSIYDPSFLTIPERDGYIFDGYFLDKDYTSKLEHLKEYEVSNGATLYAKWKEISSSDRVFGKDIDIDFGYLSNPHSFSSEIIFKVPYHYNSCNCMAMGFDVGADITIAGYIYDNKNNTLHCTDFYSGRDLVSGGISFGNVTDKETTLRIMCNNNSSNPTLWVHFSFVFTVTWYSMTKVKLANN